MSGLVAITRAISSRLADCELTHLQRAPIDLARARAQHDAYERALEALGCRVERLTAGPDMPDSVFVEDTAVVVDELAVITRPGAASRRIETAAVRDALARYRPLAEIAAPGTIDGGDVLVAGRTVYVGMTSRSNQEGIGQLARLLAPFGYVTRGVPVRGCLHLKSAVTVLSDRALLVNPSAIPAGLFGAFDLVEVDPAEPAAANILRVGTRHLYSTAFPRTLERLARHGIVPLTVDGSELAKAEGATTCGSLIVAEVGR